MDRRLFLKSVAALGILPMPVLKGRAESENGITPEFHAFSRVFQFMKDPYRAAVLLKECGYDGVEWTVRPGGFLDPSKATVSEFLKLQDAARKAGIKADNVVVSFLRGDDPGAERIAMSAKEAGFKSFRVAYFKYDRSKPYKENMDTFRRGFDTLDALARKSGLKACYQNHSTYAKDAPLLGSLIWDLANVVAAYDPRYIGIQYDPMHARAECGPSWDHSLGAIAPWIDIVCLKDFHYVLDPENPKDWKRKLVPAGTGIVDYAEVRRLMTMEGVAPRFTVHYDYPFPVDEAGARICAATDLRHYRLFWS